MRRLTPLLVALAFTGCVKTLVLGSAIGPSAPAADRSSEKAAVVCGEALLGYVERARAGLLSPGYELALGEPLCAALTRSAESAYRRAQRTAALPRRREYGRAIAFELQSGALHVLPQENGTTRVVYTVSVVVERYGRELERLGRNAVTGHGSVTSTNVSDDDVRAAVGTALQQVTDEAARLLASRIDGPTSPAR